MNVIKWVLLLALVLVGHKWWKNHQADMLPGDAAQAINVNGFAPVPAPVGANTAQVLIFAPANCPSDAAQRADAIASELAARGIAHARLQHAEFDTPDRESAEAVTRVMNGKVPIVFVRGRGKANPTVAEVLAEFGAAR